jgi:hypothetical protein
VDHLLGDHDRGVAGDLDDSAPATLGHRGQVGTDKSRRCKNIHLEVPAPLLVGDLPRWGGAEDTEVVDQDVDLGQLAHQVGHTVVVGHVGGDTDDVTVELGNDLVDAFGGAPIDRDAGTRVCQRLRDGHADALGRAGDERRLSRQIDVHALLLPLGRANYSTGSSRPACRAVRA